MRRWRMVGLVATALTMGGVLVAGAVGGLSAAETSPATATAGRSLLIFASNPLLVKAGERATLPVDVVCATAGGTPCAATVTLDVREASGSTQTQHTAVASPGLEFDLTASAARAVADASSGVVGFSLQAEDEAGHVASLSEHGSLSFYVIRDLPWIDLPVVPFGMVRSGTTVLSLPWGSGPMRAGVGLGSESLTRGPSSFDVGADGSIHLADAIQGRLAAFQDGRLAAETRLDLSPQAVVAVTGRGATYVLDGQRDRASVRLVGSTGQVGPVLDLGPGIPGELRTVGEAASAALLPADVFVPVTLGPESKAPTSFGPSVGKPIGINGEEQLLRVAREDFVRLGYVRGGAVESAVELRPVDRFAELALAEPDGAGGYVVVVRVWRTAPTPADQYQVVHVAGGRVVSTFAVSSGSFAETPPLSRFRLGPDGALFQMTTSPEGVRIVRFGLAEEES